MCTVSFVNSNGKIIITSNRDEAILRPAVPPKNYLINGKNIVFPKDTKAGGTWYAIDENANVLVLLNGAAEKHKWNPPYSRSRGLVVLEMISSGSALQSWENLNLDGVEPFTLVLYEARKLYQLRWNGTQKESAALDENQNYVWSSSTLYPNEIREKRSQWFYQFLDTKPEVNENEVFDFHRYAEEGNKQNGLVINRNDLLKTLSITQTVIEKNKVSMVHHDLISHKESANSFIIV